MGQKKRWKRKMSKKRKRWMGMADSTPRIRSLGAFSAAETCEKLLSE